MTSGIEEQVRKLLRKAADALPADQSLVDRIEQATVASPAHQPTTVPPHRRRRVLLLPALAAAAVLAIALTTATLVGSRHHAAPPVATSTAAEPTASSPTSPTASPTSSTPTRPTTSRAQSPTSSPTATPPAPPAQMMISYSPYTDTGQLTVGVSEQVTGTCFTSSATVGTPGAYRCTVTERNWILDPCFAPPNQTTPTTLACVQAPWEKARLLTLTGPLPPQTQRSTTWAAWAFQLTDGARCVISVSVALQVQGERLPYVCRPGFAASGPTLHGNSVTAVYAPSQDGPLTTQAVVTMWR